MNAICENCHQPVRWVPDYSGKVVLCERNMIVVYTERGRRVEGYPLHKCKQETGGGDVGNSA
ncbi:hypothetical protein ES708_23588 [subsurface metagenome]